MEKISPQFKEMFWIYWYKKDDPEKERQEWLQVTVREFDSENNVIRFEAYGTASGTEMDGIFACVINP